MEMRRFTWLFLVLVSTWCARSVAISVPTAIVVDDPTALWPAIPFSPVYMPVSPLDMVNLFGATVVMQKLAGLASVGGGFQVGGQAFELTPIIYNLANFSSVSQAAFAEAVVSGMSGQWPAPVMIQTPFALLPTYDDLAIHIARACTRTHTCIVSPASSTKRLFECVPEAVMDPEATECHGRPNLRRFLTILSFLPNSDYLAESFIGHMVHQQQSSMALISFTTNFGPSTFAATPAIAESYGIELRLARMMSSHPSNCNSSVVRILVDDLMATVPDFLTLLGTGEEDASCTIALLYRVKEVGYMPRAISMMGGMFDFARDLLEFRKESLDLLRFVYAVDALSSDSNAAGYRAKSTPTHTELFPFSTMMLNGTLITVTSAQQYLIDFASIFGSELAASKLASYATFSSAAQLILLQLLELSSGSLDAGLWQATASLINTPTFLRSAAV